jgi:hypothetical protein
VSRIVREGEPSGVDGEVVSDLILVRQVGPALERVYALAERGHRPMQVGLADRDLTLARATVLWRLRHEGPTTSRALSLPTSR